MVITYKSNREAAERVVNELLAAGAPSALHYQVDVSDFQSVKRFADELSSAIGYLNVLVNNAGVIDYSSVEEVTPQRWDEVIRVDLYGPFYVTKALLPLMRGAPWAAVVNVSSISGQTGNVVAGVAYAAAKAGLIGLTKKLAVELARLSIRVNAVAPSFVETDMTAQLLSDPKFRAQVIAMHPLGRIARPEDISEAIYFLADPARSGNITGHVISINGGRYT